VAEAPKEEIKLFYRDVKLLIDSGMTLNKIGDQIPKVGGSNFINYYKGELTITPDFLIKFYNHWRERLNELKAKDYNPAAYVFKPIDDLGKKDGDGSDKNGGGGSDEERFANAAQTVWESNQLMAEAYKKLSDANLELVKIIRGRGDRPDPPGGE
jgi:hypothetical protein